MSSIREARLMLQTARIWEEEGNRLALLTLVNVKGSAYRRPGAKMVMASHGQMQGTLSGGCLEGDLFLHAERAMSEGTPLLRRYDLTEDEMWGLGIGCKGQVEIWIEPLSMTDPFWQGLAKAVTQDHPVIWGGELPLGTRFFAPERAVWQVSGEKPIPFGWDEVESYGSSGVLEEFWWDVMRPPERLIIAGAGHDARPVAKLAQEAGFDVVVLDPREMVNTDEHFPGAVHLVKNALEARDDEIRDSMWVIMNHHQRRDEEALQQANRSRPRFVGVLGPRSRTEEMIQHVKLAPGLPLYSPVGLDLGAESPDEVAISIVSELMAARAHTEGGSLNGKNRIHR